MALWMDGAWRAALLRGPSGAGKSDLALRLIEGGGRLVADDRVRVWASGGRLWGRAPDSLAGRIEVRGLGVLSFAYLDWAPLLLAVDLTGDPSGIERIPGPDSVEIGGMEIARIDLFAFAVSAPHKIKLALQAATLGAGREPAYQGPARGRG